MQSGFARWINEEGQRPGSTLSSVEGTCVLDVDMIVHRFQPRRSRTPLDRPTEYMTKARAQQRKHGRFTQKESACKVITYRAEEILCYGVHILSLIGAEPKPGEPIGWDKQRITYDQLIGLLSFRLNPDSLLPMEDRSHKRRGRNLMLPFDERRGAQAS